MDNNIKSVDATNMLCPMPVIKAQNAVLESKPGQLIEVLCTDPGAKNDIPAWCRINGHDIISIDDSDERIIITIKVNDC